MQPPEPDIEVRGSRYIDAAKEVILYLNFKATDTIRGCTKKFYEIMLKHGIRKGTLIEDGDILKNTPEWVMLWTLFLDVLSSHINLRANIFEDDMPPELAHY